jgi:hypothetical protein
MTRVTEQPASSHMARIIIGTSVAGAVVVCMALGYLLFRVRRRQRESSDLRPTPTFGGQVSAVYICLVI